jgi:hypothetical protein
MNKKIDTWLPIILFTLVGISIFLTEKSDGGSIDGSMYGSTSAHGITLSKNLLNSEHPLFLFSSRELKDGKIVYDAYNRFPVFPFLITGLLIHPFEDNLNTQIYIARQLMNLFFFLSIIVVFKLVNELVKNKYIALSVALLVFSSYYMLSYHSMIFNDIPALLGFVIALYGVAIVQKKKFNVPDILFFSLLPVSLGWQPYAVFGTWLLVTAVELLLEKKISVGKKFIALIKQPSFIITALAIIWGVIILGFQLYNEWSIIGGSFTDLPSVSSGLWRSGLVSAEGRTSFLWTFDWFNFLPGQAHAMVVMLIPFWPVFQVEPGVNASIFIVISVMVYTLIRFLKDRNSDNKVLLIMIYSGLLWTIPMKHFVALHDFQSIFYVGFAISVYAMILSRINLKAWNLLSVNMALAFLITVSLSNYYKASYSSRFTNQFQNIYNQLPADSKVYFDGDRKRMTGFSRYALDLYLSNSIFTQQEDADYVISEDSDFSKEKLTHNSGFNLFRVTD